MKYLNKYANLAAYEADENKGYPNVSVIGDPEGEYEVKYEKTGNQCGYDATEWNELDYNSAQVGDTFTMTENLCESGTSEAWESFDQDFIDWVIGTAAQEGTDWSLTVTLDGEEVDVEAEQGSPSLMLHFYAPDANNSAKAPRPTIGDVESNSEEDTVTTQNFVAGQWEYIIEKEEEPF